MASATPSELIDRMIDDVFNQPDPQRRAAAIAEVFSDDVVFTDPDRTVRGSDELAAAVTELLDAGAPDFVFTHDGPFRGVGDLGMRAWSLGPAGGEVVAGGTDVVTVADGRITHLWTILG